jgi:DNA-binding SARP family transcriptional activator
MGVTNRKVEFRLLGPLEVRDGEGNPVALPRRQQRALLAALLVRAGEVVSTDRLIDDLWGERPPRSALGSLQNTVSQLRKLVGGDVLRTQPPGYVLAVAPAAVDAQRFEQLLSDAAALNAAERAASLREALALWRGPALADLSDEPWADAEAARLEELRLAAVEERIGAELELGRHGVLVAQLDALAAEHPLRERLHRQRALALYRCSRQKEALDALRAAAEALDELGLEPTGELRQLERDILNQSPALDPPAAETPADEVPEAAGERRVVSVLAATVAEDEDPERLRGSLDRLLDTANRAVPAHGGEIEAFGPDGLTAVFGAAEAREDDALRAVRAAVAMHEDVGTAVGVATGEALIGEHPRVAGSAVARAAGLARVGGGVLVDPRTYELVRDAVTAEHSGPVSRVLTVSAARPLAGLNAPLVGRAAELARLRAAFDVAVADQACRTVTVVGEAGIGKSRLARELAGSLAAQVLVGRCAAYGEGATFVPLVEALRDVDAAIADDELVAKRIAALAGAAQEPGSLGESYWAVRRVLEALAQERPVLLLLDDVHWAEPALLDLVEYLAARVTDAPLLVLCLARPELLDARPGWASDALRLEPLAADETRELVTNTVEALEDDARERIVDLAEGNPLYAQQLAAYAAESGKALEPGAMPATIDAVLAGRLGRLDAGERATLQRAAVVGREFSRGAVAALAPPDLAVDAHLLALARRGFVRALPEPLPGDDAYRFHHVLLRDAAYATLTKEQRADLHERVAAWLDRDGPGDDALVGYHLEQAAVLSKETGRDADELAAAAGERLGSAGSQAWARNDGWAARGLLERALRLLPHGSLRATITFEWSILLHTQGRDRAADAALEEALADAVAAGARAIEIRARLELARLAHGRGEVSSDELLASATEAIAALETAHDDRGLGRAWLTVSDVYSFRCQMEAMGEAAERAFHHYRLLGGSGQAALGTCAEALFYGPVHVDRAIPRARALLDQAIDRAAEASVEAVLGALHALSGQFHEARRLAERARQLYEDVGSLPVSFETNLTPLFMEIERLAGDFDEVAAIGVRSVDVLLGFGANAHAATRAAQVADVEITRGNVADAARLLEIAQRNALEGDVLTQFLNRAIEARLLAHRGRHRPAQALAAEAVHLSSNTDAIADRVRTLVALEEVSRLGGKHEDARQAAVEAERLLTAKGSSAGLARLRERLGDVLPA